MSIIPLKKLIEYKGNRYELSRAMIELAKSGGNLLRNETKYRKGKYGRMVEGPTSHAATANCPMLCVIPPATLTPKAEMCKRVLFFKKFMMIRLNTLPARL